MPTYAYMAVGDEGKTVSGSLTAENQQVALRLLEEKSLFPLNVQEAHAVSAVTGRRKGIKLRYLTAFYQQLADLLGAGVPMLRGLDVLSAQAGIPPVLQQGLKESREDVAGGATLADALEKNPQIFKPLHCSMIRAGEHGGFLEDVLTRLAGFAEKQDALRNKLIGAMIYPALLMGMGSTVFVLIMTMVVPKLREHLREENYNIMTTLVFTTCDILLDYYPVLIGVIVVTVVGVQTIRNTVAGKRAIAVGQLKAPVFGKLYSMVSVSRFCRILGTLLKNGVPVLQALKIAKDSAGNEVLAECIDSATESVRRGETLSNPLGESGLFPGDILSMIAVAEESNNLENVLVKIAETNELRTERAIETAMRFVEPMLLFMMAVGVGIIAFALLLPILTMGSSVG